MLSFKTGNPIALVCGGQYDGKKLRITEDQEHPDQEPPHDILELLDNLDLHERGGRKALKAKDRLILQLALSRGDEPQESRLSEIYHRGKTRIQDKLKYELNLEDEGQIQILPPAPTSENPTERIYIAGKSGSGKSYLACFYMLEYLRMPTPAGSPPRKVILFSRHEEEKTYQHIPHIAVKLDKGFTEEALDVKLLANSLCVFDDTDNIQDKAISVAIRRLNDDLISNGRKYGISVLTLAHQLMNYSHTRNILNEANRVIFFNSGSNYHIQRYLKIYAGLSKEQIKKIMDIKSRWTCISHSIPAYVLHQTGAFVLK